MEKKEEDAKPVDVENTIRIADGLFFWIAVLVLALVVRIVTGDLTVFAPGTAVYSFLNAVSNFFLFNAGSLILPLIIGAVIGAEVGKRSSSVKNALKAGLLNSVYAGIVYMIAIVVIYEVILYALPQAGVTVLFLIRNLMLPQVLILIAVVEVFAFLSNMRRVNS